jgi:predicted RNA-binding protein with PUA-like domain
MKRGDRVLFYESVTTKAAVGIAQVAKTAYPDTTADEPGWLAVDLKAVSPLSKPVTLAQIKDQPALRDIALLRQSRLSVMPLSEAAYQIIVKLGS